MSPHDPARSEGPQASLFHDTPVQHSAAARSALSASKPRRLELLREELPHVIGLVERRRLDLVEQGIVADYLALRWIEWRDGELRLTDAGHVVRESAQR